MGGMAGLRSREYKLIVQDGYIAGEQIGGLSRIEHRSQQHEQD
jgi:hypothetical protein